MKRRDGIKKKIDYVCNQVYEVYEQYQPLQQNSDVQRQ